MVFIYFDNLHELEFDLFGSESTYRLLLITLRPWETIKGKANVQACFSLRSFRDCIRFQRERQLATNFFPLSFLFWASSFYSYFRFFGFGNNIFFVFISVFDLEDFLCVWNFSYSSFFCSFEYLDLSDAQRAILCSTNKQEQQFYTTIFFWVEKRAFHFFYFYFFIFSFAFPFPF